MKRIVFLTGAGISKASGLSTFRDAHGLWKTHNVDDVASRRGYMRNRRRVIDFHNQLRRLVDAAEPNAAHVAIADAARTGDFRVTVITQNVDDLHERAGIPDVMHMHGSLHRAQVKRYRTPVVHWTDDITDDSLPEPGWERSRGTMRHDVVLFGEQVKHMREAREQVRSADALIVCGTSLEVFPVASLLEDARQAYKVLVDPNPVKLAEFDLWIPADAVSGMPEAIDASSRHIKK